MSNLKGQQNCIDTQAVVGQTVITLTGESIHSNRDAYRCAELVAEALDALDYLGEYRVLASMQRLKGSSHLQGLSTNGVSINAVLLGYQPHGNDSRATYTLQFPNADEAQKCLVVLKEFLVTAYDAKPKIKAEKLLFQPIDTAAEALEVIPSLPAVLKPTQKPNVYYTSDSDWMETFVLYLSELSDRQLEKLVTKSQVLDLILEHTAISKRFHTGPIWKTLKDRGYVNAFDDREERWSVSCEPLPSKPSKALKMAKPEPQKVPAKKKQKYLSDEEWMRSFVAGLRELVPESGAEIKKADLHRFIKERTNQKKVANVVYKVVEGLKVRGIIFTAGEIRYRVVYEPAPDVVEKAAAEMAHVRAERDKVFNGLAKFRLPTFAEGMIFGDSRILNDFLTQIRGGMTKSSAMMAHLYELYPVTSRSHALLLNYLVGQGFLIHVKKGHYSLGPKGRERLGLKAIVYKDVTIEAVVETPPVSVVEAIPVPKPEGEMLQAFMPPGQQVLSPPAAPSSVLSDPSDTVKLAEAVQKARRYSQEADASEAREVELRERDAALDAELAIPFDVELEVRRRLEVMLADL